MHLIKKMASSTEIFIVIMSIIGVTIALWYFIVADKYKRQMNSKPYARGASVRGLGTDVNMKCDEGQQICVYRATQICSSPDANNFENRATDPISKGDTTTFYGEFDPNTTVDITDALGDSSNGNESKIVNFADVAAEFPGAMTCAPDDTQLIATYKCISPGSSCSSYKS